MIIKSLDHLQLISRKIADRFSEKDCIFLIGEIGVGKTTLIKALSLHLGVTDIVSSPTFSIVNEYQAYGNTKIYHFDFYRIDDEKEAYDIGYEEYFFSDAYCFIEWPEKIPNLIEEDMVQIKMSVVENKRRIELII